MVSGLGGEALYRTFAPPPELVSNTNLSMGPVLAREQSVANIKNATLSFGLLGAVLGMSLGIAGGVVRRSTNAAVLAGAVGLVVAGAAGAQMAWALTPIAERNQTLASENLAFAFLIHGGIWATVGAAGGLALGLGLGGRGNILRATIGGLVGGALGTTAYDLIGALAFPMAGTGGALSTAWGARLLAHLCVAIPAALGAAAAIQATVIRPSEDKLPR
jgi:hypothetical protein